MDADPLTVHQDTCRVVLCVHVCACVCESWVLIHIHSLWSLGKAWMKVDLPFFYCPNLMDKACVDFGVHPSNWWVVVLKSTCLLVGFLLKIWMFGNWFNHASISFCFLGCHLPFCLTRFHITMWLKLQFGVFGESALFFTCWIISAHQRKNWSLNTYLLNSLRQRPPSYT
jgi:hypothetical protein